MRHLRLPILLCFAAARLHGDVLIEQKTEGWKPGLTIMKVKGERARIDMDGATGKVTVMIDASGKIVTYVHQSKLALVTRMTESQKAAKDLLKKAGTDAAKPEQFTNTGETEKVGEWNCEIWIRHTPSVTHKEWRAKDVPNLKRIQEQMAVLASAPGMAFDPASRGDAYTVKTERNDAKGTLTTTVTKLSEEPISESEFTLPVGYQEMAVPAQ